MHEVDRIWKRIEENRQAMIDLQAALTAVPALSPDNGGEGEWRKAALLQERLEELGLRELQMLPAPDERVPGGKRPNLLATLPGKPGGRTFWVMTHLDVVPPGELSLWKSDPFRMAVDGGRLIGRGVEDNQQEMVASIFAAASFLQLGIAPACTVKLLFVADEETGSKYGIQHILREHRLFTPSDLILVPDGGNPQGTDIEIAEKHLLWLRLRTRGKQCHASRPDEGINAFVAGSELALELYGLNRVHTERDPLFQPPVSTFTPTKKEANVPNINTIPGDDVFYLDSRVLPSLDLDEVLREIGEIARRIEGKHGVTVEIDTVQRNSSPPTPQDTPLVGLLQEGIRRVYAVEGQVVGIGGGTVGAYLRQAGYDTVIWSRVEETAHQPNEYCLVDNMAGDARVMAWVMAADRSR